jgi:hypothetical protein
MVHGALVPHDQPSIIIHPPKAAFYLPPVAVVGPRVNRSPTLGTLPGPPRERGNRRLYASPAQIPTEAPAIVGSVRDQLRRARTWTPPWTWHLHRGQRRCSQRAFMRLGAVHMQTDRQALAIGDNHHLRALADFGLADAGPPFFAGTKLPSRNACVHSSLPWASSWLNSTRHSCSQVPSWDHVLNRRQHVAGEPYTRGTSSQVQPVFSTKRMPLSVRRSSFRFRPGPAFCCGMRGSMMVHCSSVRSCRLMPTV